ncbi:methyltransferase [Kaustia mangrovi]|uniref:Methyltransferase n=1 Tax=Kaustia mangrovi TaxID=2593653 RepID=A0A7S8HC38_9HYPH|nr:50S ribosomal protein L11 methyltransferase [Kaustia mangrovi]QPC43230.1 methyltransferase [Kaustia mangrovi]
MSADAAADRHYPLHWRRACELEGFVAANTRLQPVSHAPEISLHLAHEALPLWGKTEEELGEIGLPPPFWAFAWAGGQALARYVLDTPETVRGRRVLDLGAGSGLVAIAAAKAGATVAIAADIDPFARVAIRLNARANGVSVTASSRDWLSEPPDGDAPFDVALIGDLFYEAPLARRVLRWLDDHAARARPALIGDPGRSYLPRERLDAVAEYRIAGCRELEDTDVKRTRVWRLSQAGPD